MSIQGSILCDKTLVTKCHEDYLVEGGSDIEWIVTVRNGSNETAIVEVRDALSTLINPNLDTIAVVTTYLGGASGSSPSAGPFVDYVTLPPGGQATYAITATTRPSYKLETCPAVVANIAEVTVISTGGVDGNEDVIVCPKTKTLSTPYLAILQDDGDPHTEVHGDLPETNYHTDLFALFDPNGAGGRYVNQLVLNGLTIWDVLAQLITNGAVVVN